MVWFVAPFPSDALPVIPERDVKRFGRPAAGAGQPGRCQVEATFTGVAVQPPVDIRNGRNQNLGHQSTRVLWSVFIGSSVDTLQRGGADQMEKSRERGGT